MKRIGRILLPFLGWVLLLVSAVCAQTLSEPTWPQKFEVLRGEHASFGFVASQPGPISITVQLAPQSVPVIVSLARLDGPLAPPVEKPPATGTITVNYTATASDVARSSIWVVQIREPGTAASISGTSQPIIVDQKISAHPPLAPVAWGTITVAHPAGDLNRARAELAARPRPQPRAAQTNALAQQVLQQRKALYQKAVANAQAAQTQLLATQYPRAAKANASATQVSNVNMVKIGAATTASHAQVGPAKVSQTITILPPPVITAIDSGKWNAQGTSINHGQPGDPLVIKGTGLSCCRKDNDPFVNYQTSTYCVAEVHFILNPGMDVGFPSICHFPWEPSEIDVAVPDVSGVQAYDGQIYLRNPDTGVNSAPVPFHFDPTLDFAQLKPQCDDPDAQINKNDFACPYVGVYDINHDGSEDIWGHKAEDLFYLTKTLKNGWVVDSCAVVNTGDPVNPHYATGVSVNECRVGTNSPYVDVHWWTDAWDWVEYTVVVNIKGPKGLPYQ